MLTICKPESANPKEQIAGRMRITRGSLLSLVAQTKASASLAKAAESGTVPEEFINVLVGLNDLLTEAIAVTGDAIDALSKR